jgi:hypothetical protein
MVPQRPFFSGKPGCVRVECPDLALFVDRQNDLVLGRVDIKPDDRPQFRGEVGVIGQLELADPVRLQAVFSPNALYRTDADPDGFGHGRACPVGSFAIRRPQRTADNLVLDLGSKWRDARRPAFIAQQAADALGHEAGLPAPHGGLAGAGAVHDLGGAAAISGQQHNVRTPNVLLRAVAIPYDRRKSLAVVGCDVDGDPGAHATDSHAARCRGIPLGLFH